MKKVSKKRILEYVIVFVCFALLLFIVFLNFSAAISERDHIRWHKEHADISVREHNSSITEVVASVSKELSEEQNNSAEN